MLEVRKLGIIGIDRVVLNNFKIQNFEKLEKKEIITDLELQQRLEKKNELIKLNYSLNLKSDNQLYLVSTLEFNPNRILHNHNIYNSTVLDLKKSIEIIVFNLAREGIEISLEDARIKELEINYTYLKDFQELEEVLLLIGRANYEKSLSMSSFRQEDIPSKIKFDRSLYINSKMPDYKKEITGKVIKLYDKTYELYKNRGIQIEEKLTRIEVLLGRDYYRSKMTNLGLTNTLKDLISNPTVIKTLYLDALEKELKEKPLKYIETLKKNLTYDFLNFKRVEKAKRKERARLTKLGKEVPDIFKEQRGVFEYLYRESWIFDYSLLLEIIATKIESKHRKIYEKQIIDKYITLNNKEKYEELLKKIFDNFF